MFNLSQKFIRRHALEADAYSWFTKLQHGHMDQWGYTEPEYDGDLVRGSELWDIWEQKASQKDNMLNRQGQIIAEQIDDMVSLSAPCHTLVDLGPGGMNAVNKNTIPFATGYKESLKNYVAIDVSVDSAKGASDTIRSIHKNINASAIESDFFDPSLNIPHDGQVTALMMGGTIGNFEAKPNTPNALHLMASRIKKLKSKLPTGSIVFIGLEATQNAKTLYESYDDPVHAEFEINVMHAIKRDLLFDQDGFNPYAWKYAMKWYPDSHQFCHIAEATELQRFDILGEDIRIPKGHQLIIDNSFKFPVLAMQKSAQLAGLEYLKPFSDDEGRMMIHAIRF